VLRFWEHELADAVVAEIVSAYQAKRPKTAIPGANRRDR
jgi:hypothetical protein